MVNGIVWNMIANGKVRMDKIINLIQNNGRHPFARKSIISVAIDPSKKASKLLKQEIEGQLHLNSPFSSLFFFYLLTLLFSRNFMQSKSAILVS